MSDKWQHVETTNEVWTYSAYGVMSSQPLIFHIISIFFEFHVMQDFVHQPYVASWGLWHYSGVHVQPGLRIFCGWWERFSVKLLSEVDFYHCCQMWSVLFILLMFIENFFRGIWKGTEKVIVKQTWHLGPPAVCTGNRIQGLCLWRWYPHDRRWIRAHSRSNVL